MPNPLEQFLIEYVDAVGGLTDQVEPQVYDVLLPNAAAPQRVVFDPDALPEHTSAQLFTFGSRLLDQMLEQAQARGHVARAFLDDVHLTPHALIQRVKRDFKLPETLTMQIEAARPLYVTHSLFWFEVTYASDEKEQSLYPVAVDRYYGREVRYLEPLLESERLADIRRWAYPDAKARPLEQAYLTAREGVLRTVRAEATSRKHDMLARQQAQRERMQRYYADLRAEMQERVEKAAQRGEEVESLRLRLGALEREEALRLDELERKAVLRVQLNLTNVLHVKIPRLFLTARLLPAEGAPAPRPASLTLTWDPLTEKTDALACPNCQHPTFELRLGRQSALHCPGCEPPGRR